MLNNSIRFTTILLKINSIVAHLKFTFLNFNGIITNFNGITKNVVTAITQVCIDSGNHFTNSETRPKILYKTKKKIRENNYPDTFQLSIINRISEFYNNNLSAKVVNVFRFFIISEIYQ